MSKLARYCEGLLEATWLSALICVPLFYAVWGESVQGEKNFLLRSLAILLVAAWSIRAVVQISSRRDQPLSKRFSLRETLGVPLVAPVVLWALLLLASTVLSLDPEQSFMGQLWRRTGTYTHLSCLLLFAAIARWVRSGAQVDRIITAVVVTSIPISVYAIGQNFGVEPLSPLGVTPLRAGSTLGNPIFLGGYLIMVLPLTLSRLLLNFLPASAGGAAGKERALDGALYGVTAALQGLALLFTASRGPILGLVTSLLIALLLAGFSRQTFVQIMKWLGAAMLAMIAVALIGSPEGPLRGQKPPFIVQRFAEMLDPQDGSSGRTAIWKVGVQAAAFSKTVEFPPSGQDPFRSVRWLAGYGPENVESISRLYCLQDYNTAMGGHITFDRFHNDFWDTLISLGVLGCALHLGLSCVVLYYGFLWLGFVSKGQAGCFWTFLLGGGILGAFALAAWPGPEFLGVGWRLGNVLGLSGYLYWRVRQNSVEQTGDGPTRIQRVTMIALLGGIIAHLTEIAFSFSVETTLVYFWIYIGLLFAVGHRLTKAQINALASAEKGKRAARPRPQAQTMFSVSEDATPIRAAAAGGVIVALVFVQLGAMLIQKSEASSATMTIVHSLTRLSETAEASPGLAIPALLCVWFLCARISSGTTRLLNTGIRARHGPVVLALSGFAAFLYWLILAQVRATTLGADRVTLDTLDPFLRGHTVFVDLHYGFTFLLVLLLGACLRRDQAHGVAMHSPRRWWAAPALAMVVISLGSVVYLTNLKWSKIGILAQWAEGFNNSAQLTVADAICRRALEKEPRASHLHLALGRVLTGQARRPEQSPARELFSEADRSFQRASELKPLDPAPIIERARLRTVWAEQAPENRGPLARKADELYRDAVRLDPGNYELMYGIGKNAVILRTPAQAAAAYESALALAPASELWISHEMLARLRADLADPTGASNHLARAIELAPPGQREPLLKLRNKIHARR